MISTTICTPFPASRASEDTSFREGWFYPGDRGYLRRDGMLVVTGRQSEVLNAGGVKLAHEVVEAALQSHPSIREAAAFGVFARDGMEEIAAAIVASGPLNARQVIDWCAARGIPLARIHVMDALPVTPSGKLHRAALKQAYA